MPDNKETKYGTAVNKTCPYCQTKIKQDADYTLCAQCGTPHHRECWNENKGCTTFGCKENPLVRKNTSSAVNPSTVNPSQVNPVIDVGNHTVQEIQQLLDPAQQERDTPPADRLTNCPQCNSLVDENSRFCKFCGYSFIENQTPIKRNQFEREYIQRYKQRVSLQRKGAWLTLSSLIILFGVILIAGYFAFFRGNPYSDSSREEITSALISWKTAWENKDPQKYQQYLAPHYQYVFIEADKDRETKLSRAQRIQRINWTFKRYDYIKIHFSNIKIQPDPADSTKAIVYLDEKYTSDKYNDEGEKTLYLYKDTQGWKIYKEVFRL